MKETSFVYQGKRGSFKNLKNGKISGVDLNNMADEREIYRKTMGIALKRKYGSATDPNRIEQETESEYLSRLKSIYIKDKERKCFFDQYKNAPGHELDGSFWSPRSSSRFAFEAYSWLATQSFCKDIEFEYKLPKIRDGRGNENARIIPPTMDVFFRTESEICFIESKFLEFGSVKYNFKGLKPSYYEETRPGLLVNRYYGSKRISDLIPKFIKNIKLYLDSKEKDFKDFFEPKQEITHLIGIGLWLHRNPAVLSEIKSGKTKISFFNVVYRFAEKDNAVAKDFRCFFLANAQKTFRDIFGIELNYKIKYSQDFVKELLLLADKKDKTRSFASNVPVLQQLEQFSPVE